MGIKRIAVLAGVLLLAAMPAAESRSLKAQCHDRCRLNYKTCIKSLATAKGRALCKAARKSCDGLCGK